MKRIVFILVLLFVKGNLLGQGLDFEVNFIKIFEASIGGLESFKGEEKGVGWKSEVELKGGDCAIFFDKEKGLYYFKANFLKNDKESAKAAKKSLADRIEVLLPKDDFIKAESYSSDCFDYMKIVIDYNSTKFADKKKRPIIELHATSGDEAFLELYIFESYFKNQYSFK